MSIVYCYKFVEIVGCIREIIMSSYIFNFQISRKNLKLSKSKNNQKTTKKFLNRKPKEKLCYYGNYNPYLSLNYINKFDKTKNMVEKE